MNPIIKGFYPDPSICKKDDDYYLVNSSFGYSPGIPIFHSQDLVNWEQIGNCLEHESAVDLTGTPASGGIFAPTIRYYDGTFYIITTNAATRKNFYIQTTDPYQGWSTPIKIDNWPGIDPSFFFDDDGKVYVQGTRDFFSDEIPGIYQSEFNIETGQVLTPRQLISEGTGGAAAEGPHVYKLNGYYYLTIAEGGTEYGHMVTLFRSSTVNGPFVPYQKNPIVTNRSIEGSLQCTGHGDLVVDDQQNPWLVCLGVRATSEHLKYHQLGRETMLVPLNWDAQGWPVPLNGAAVNLVMQGPLKQNQIIKNNSFSINFTKANKLPLNWVYLRNPTFNNYHLTAQGLQLVNTTDSLSTDTQLTFVGFRQTEFKTRLAVSANINLEAGDSESGFSTYMSKRFHYDLAVLKENEKYYIVFKKTVGDIDVTLKKIEIMATDLIQFNLESDQFNYQFSVLINGDMIEMGTGQTILLSSEVAGTYTGVMFALYACGQVAVNPGTNLLNITNLDYQEK